MAAVEALTITYRKACGPHRPASITTMVRALCPRRLLTVAGAALLASACDFSAGPAYLRIDTGGERYTDFVIEPVQENGLIHSSEMVRMPARVVSTEEDLTLPAFETSWNFTTLLVSAYHPEFVYTWTGKADSSSEDLTLSPLHPQKWTDFLREHGRIALERVADHLDHLLLVYVPAFEAGEPRRRLRRYLPGLEALVRSASWSTGDARRWATASEARQDLARRLDRLSDLMG